MCRDVADCATVEYRGDEVEGGERGWGGRSKVADGLILEDVEALRCNALQLLAMLSEHEECAEM